MPSHGTTLVRRLRARVHGGWVPGRSAPASEPPGAPADAPTTSASRPVQFIASRLRRLVERQTCATVASFGCGDGRELQLLHVPPGRRLKFWGVQPDAQGREILRRHAGDGRQVNLVDKAVLRMTAADCPRLDLAYSFGLLESLKDAKAVRAMRIMAAQVRPGGEVIVGNWCPRVAPVPPWPRGRRAIPRSAPEMQRLADLAFAPQLWTRSIVHVGAFSYIRARRLAY